MTPNRRSPWIERFLHFYNSGPVDECWEWQGYVDVRGYGVLGFDGRNWTTHQLSFALHNGDLPAGAHICHHCDNRRCCNPAHLYAGTAATNTADKVRRGRMVVHAGSANGYAKLTELLVSEMREAWESGEWTQRGLARRFNVSQSNVYYIVNRLHWKHVA